MDPDAALAAFLDACRDHYRDAALEHIEALRRWIADGGFLPSDPRQEKPGAP